MALPNTAISLAAFLLLQSLSATSDLLSPLLSPVFGDVCEEAVCGKGTCKPSNNGTFPFICECERGWKQTSSDDDKHFKFLPCIFPNCTLDYSCSKAPSPAQQEKERKANGSIFDACRWVDCGGGSCNKTSTFSYNCECDAGYYNLLNVTAFPCFRECSLGMDCSKLGISLSNSSAAPPSLIDNGKSEAGSILRERSHWLMMLMMFMAKILMG